MYGEVCTFTTRYIFVGVMFLPDAVCQSYQNRLIFHGANRKIKGSVFETHCIERIGGYSRPLVADLGTV